MANKVDVALFRRQYKLHSTTIDITLTTAILLPEIPHSDLLAPSLRVVFFCLLVPATAGGSDLGAAVALVVGTDRLGLAGGTVGAA